MLESIKRTFPKTLDGSPRIPEVSFKPLACFRFVFSSTKKRQQTQAGLTFGQSAGPNFTKGKIKGFRFYEDLFQTYLQVEIRFNLARSFRIEFCKQFRIPLQLPGFVGIPLGTRDPVV